MKKMFKMRIFIFLFVLFIATATFAMKKLDYGNPCTSSYCNCTMTMHKFIPYDCGDTSKIEWKCECDCNGDGTIDFTDTGWACGY